jgi:hypothetical protein
MAVKGFREARSTVINALRRGSFRHELRSLEKNILRAGDISPIDVVDLLLLCRGDQYRATPHHQLPCDVSIFKPTHRGVLWYIKVYFLSDLIPLAEGEPDTMFISVHPSETDG